MNELTHIDSQGQARMVDVGHKKPQRRIAKASGSIIMQPETLALIREDKLKKGDVLTVAQIAGIQATKRCFELIPLCHPIVLDRIQVNLSISDTCVDAFSEVACVGRTGVEMEALTAVSVALLTVYDMCKAVDKQMQISNIKLVSKEKSDVEPH